MNMYCIQHQCLYVAQNIVTSVKSIKVKSVKTNITFGEQSLVYVYCIKD